MRRILFRRTGGPETLEVEQVAGLAPGESDLLVRHEAIGVNFIDIYHRSGLYPVDLPAGLGSEAAGVVEAVGGSATSRFKVGDRIGYFSGPPGAYATHRLIAAKHAVRLPDGIDAESAAATMLKGCTAEYLIERCARVAAGETVLVHAAAGGTGSILVPWLKAIGATVIAHTGSKAKSDVARQLGADHVLSCPMEQLSAEVRRLTDGKGADKILDGVGAASWQASLAAATRRGLLVSFGNASGPVPPFSPLDLTRAGSIYVTRPTLADYIAEPGEMEASANRLFDMIEQGHVQVRVGARYPLDGAAEAHRALEARETTGSTLLLP